MKSSKKINVEKNQQSLNKDKIIEGKIKKSKNIFNVYFENIKDFLNNLKILNKHFSFFGDKVKISKIDFFIFISLTALFVSLAPHIFNLINLKSSPPPWQKDVERIYTDIINQEKNIKIEIRKIIESLDNKQIKNDIIEIKDILNDFVKKIERNKERIAQISNENINKGNNNQYVKEENNVDKKLKSEENNLKYSDLKNFESKNVEENLFNFNELISDLKKMISNVFILKKIEN